jgi:hypothetical protein
LDELWVASEQASGTAPLFVHHLGAKGAGGFDRLRQSAARSVAAQGLPVGVLELFQSAFGFGAQQTY